MQATCTPPTGRSSGSAGSWNLTAASARSRTARRRPRTGDPEGWAILYRVPEDGAPHTIDDARPYSVISATGKRAHFIGWRKVGRRRLGIGIGSPPVERI